MVSQEDSEPLEIVSIDPDTMKSEFPCNYCSFLCPTALKLKSHIMRTHVLQTPNYSDFNIGQPGKKVKIQIKPPVQKVNMGQPNRQVKVHKNPPVKKAKTEKDSTQVLV